MQMNHCKRHSSWYVRVEQTQQIGINCKFVWHTRKCRGGVLKIVTAKLEFMIQQITIISVINFCRKKNRMSISHNLLYLFT